VLAPGVSNEMRCEVDALAWEVFPSTVLHAYSTPACVDVHVLRKCRLRASAFHLLLTAVDCNVWDWNRSFPTISNGSHVKSMIELHRVGSAGDSSTVIDVLEGSSSNGPFGTNSSGKATSSVQGASHSSNSKDAPGSALYERNPT